MKIGNISIGIYHGSSNSGLKEWIKFLKPKKQTCKYSYYQYFYRWLCFFIIKTRQCDICNRDIIWLNKTPHDIWSIDGKKILLHICDECYRRKIYKSNDGITYCGPSAWIQEQLENATEDQIYEYNRKMSYKINEYIK